MKNLPALSILPEQVNHSFLCMFSWSLQNQIHKQSSWLSETYLCQTAPKAVHKEEHGVQKRGKNKTLNEEMSVKDISRISRIFKW